MFNYTALIVFCLMLSACNPTTPTPTPPIGDAASGSTAAIENPPTREPQPTETPVPTGTPVPTSTLEPTRTPKPTSTPTALPEWVTDFAQPILNVLVDRIPDYSEDFSEVSPGWEEKLMFCNMQEGNECGISEGVLSASTAIKDHWAVLQIPCKIGFVNFAMSVDINTSQLNKENAAGIGYEHRGSEFSFEIKDRGRWWSLIGVGAMWDSDSGQIRISSIQPVIHFMVIADDGQVAFYLNDTPVTQAEFITVKNDLNLTLRAWSGGGTARVKYDNIKIWDLDKVPELQ